MTLALSHRPPRILYICGSINQTTQLHAVARAIGPHRAFFTPFYGDTLFEIGRRLGLIEATIGGNKRRGWCEEYLRVNGLACDLGGRSGGYDLVVSCTDLIVPRNVRGTKLVVVQEGIFDPRTPLDDLILKTRVLPRWLRGTALTGMSDRYEVLCVASAGYREDLIANGADPARIAVTGIPNFDDCRRYAQNDFPLHGFVLACTSDTRETFKLDSRRTFLKRVVEIAADRPLVFKLHPNENVERATREIARVAPGARVYRDGSAEHMIANCDVLVTEWSSTAFVGLALGKEVHSNFPIAELRRLCPLQNGGRSAANIAAICRELLRKDGRITASAARSHRFLPEVAFA